VLASWGRSWQQHGRLLLLEAFQWLQWQVSDSLPAVCCVKKFAVYQGSDCFVSRVGLLCIKGCCVAKYWTGLLLSELGQELAAAWAAAAAGCAHVSNGWCVFESR
jgi:hypothetical protein